MNPAAPVTSTFIRPISQQAKSSSPRHQLSRIREPTSRATAGVLVLINDPSGPYSLGTSLYLWGIGDDRYNLAQ